MRQRNKCTRLSSPLTRTGKRSTISYGYSHARTTARRLRAAAATRRHAHGEDLRTVIVCSQWFTVWRCDTRMNLYAKYLRWLYRSGRPSLFARLQNRIAASAFAAGIAPKRVATLDVRGRRSGRIASFPVVIADYEAERYLVAMLGQNVNWVRNVRADGGRAVLRHGRSEQVILVEVELAARPAILRRYLTVAPGARPHIAVDCEAPLSQFALVAPGIPVFRITTAPK
jgi:F420H(2)-dependent quinone reductase